VADLLAGKSAFITGGAQGIGLAVARAFLAEGAGVTIADIAPEALEAARHELDAAAPGRVRSVRLNVTDEHATEQAASEAASAYGRVDVVVPNAGVLILSTRSTPTSRSGAACST
jgi:NAD(P)-dependent dehydrogenase (short-subunit alcohol dehydrogenase family)